MQTVKILKALLIKDGEIVPFFKTHRRMRMTHLGSVLQEVGYSVDWVTSRFDHSSKSFRQCTKKQSITGINIKQFPALGYFSNSGLRRFLHNIMFGLQVAVFLLIYGYRYKLIVVSFPTLEALFPVYILSYFLDFELWIDVRDKWPPPLSDSSNKHFVYRFYLSINNFFLSLLFSTRRLKIIAISKELLEWLLFKSTRLGKSPSFICPLGSSLLFNSTCMHSSRQNLNIIYVGSLGNSYDVLGFARALLKLELKVFNSITFNVIGSGTHFAHLNALSNNIPSESPIQIMMHGYQESDYINDICKSSHIGLVPHIEDGLVPNKVGEYLAYALFLLYTPKGSMEKLIPSNAGCRLHRNYSNLEIALQCYLQISSLDIIITSKNIYNSEFYYKSFYKNRLPPFK